MITPRLLLGAVLATTMFAVGEGCGAHGRLDGEGRGSWHWPWDKDAPREAAPPSPPSPQQSPSSR